VDSDRNHSVKGPLSVAYKEDSRRAHPRLKFNGRAEIRVLPDVQKFSGTIVDLSLGGCCIELGGPIRADAFCRVEVRLCVEGTNFQVAGILRHRQDGFRVGIEFTDVSDRKAEQIRELIVYLVETAKARPIERDGD
jgi:c-di-GMP-binding flagellar brake protein YcgR